MNDHGKALEAAKVLKDYCKSMSACYDCMFCTVVDGWERNCVLGCCVCEKWDLSEAERTCHDKRMGN